MKKTLFLIALLIAAPAQSRYLWNESPLCTDVNGNLIYCDPRPDLNAHLIAMCEGMKEEFKGIPGPQLMPVYCWDLGFAMFY